MKNEGVGDGGNVEDVDTFLWVGVMDMAGGSRFERETRHFLPPFSGFAVHLFSPLFAFCRTCQETPPRL